MIRHFETTITKESAQKDLELLQSVIEVSKLAKKFTGIELNLDHSFPRNTIAILAMLYRAAQRHKLEKSFLAELGQTDSVVTAGRYGELSERYLALMIAEKEFPDISQALPEHKVLGDSNPDWTFRTKQGLEFYLEVSAITIQKIVDDLQAFGGRIPTRQIISAHNDPLYFEVIFPDNPRNFDPGTIGRLIAEAARTQALPATLTHNGLQILVDLLSTRRQLPQLISNDLNSGHLLKSTRLMGGRLAYTLATKISFKEVTDKISQKKKSNKLDQIGNAWVCIFVDDTELKNFSKDGTTIKHLQTRVSRSKWLNGVIVAGRYQDTNGNWKLSYVRID